MKDLTYRVQMSGAVKGEQVLMNRHFPLVHDESDKGKWSMHEFICMCLYALISGANQLATLHEVEDNYLVKHFRDEICCVMCVQLYT